MAWLLTSKETEQVRQEFLAIDTDRQGTISLGELRDLMVRKFLVAEIDVVNIFNAIDANHDDEIHYSEFLAAMLSTKIEMHDKLLDSAFRNFDKDLSGYITVDNLQDAFGNTFDGQNMESLIKEADTSQDGQISFPEFVAYVRGTPIASQSVQLSYPPGCPPESLQVAKPKTRDIADGAADQKCCSIM
jgi:calcium-dependent protein kinase